MLRWFKELCKRVQSLNIAVVALANKLARVSWAILTKREMSTHRHNIDISVFLPTKFAGALIDRGQQSIGVLKNLCGITVNEGRPI